MHITLNVVTATLNVPKYESKVTTPMVFYAVVNEKLTPAVVEEHVDVTG